MGTTDAASGMSSDAVLAHFGVKGMHWGVRKEEPEAVAPSKPARRVADSLDVKAVNKTTSKVEANGTRVLSNKELQGLITRMNLEQQYTKLIEGPEVKPGKTFIDKLLSNANKAQQLNNHLNSPLAKVLIKNAKNGIKLSQKVAKTKTAKVAVGAGLALL